jgi:hypothetical protein
LLPARVSNALGLVAQGYTIKETMKLMEERTTPVTYQAVYQACLRYNITIPKKSKTNGKPTQRLSKEAQSL